MLAPPPPPQGREHRWLSQPRRVDAAQPRHLVRCFWCLEDDHTEAACPKNPHRPVFGYFPDAMTWMPRQPYPLHGNLFLLQWVQASQKYAAGTIVASVRILRASAATSAPGAKAHISRSNARRRTQVVIGHPILLPGTLPSLPGYQSTGSAALTKSPSWAGSVAT